MSSAPPSTSSSSFATANAYSSNVLGGGVPAENPGKFVFDALSKFRAAVVSHTTAGGGATGGGAGGQGANKVVDMEAVVLDLQSKYIAQSEEMGALKTTMEEQKNEMELLKEAVANRENEIRSLEATLKSYLDTQQKGVHQGLATQHDTLPVLASPVKELDDDLHGLKTEVSEQAGLASELSTLGALLQGQETKTTKQHQSIVALDLTVTKLQEDLQGLKTEVSKQLRRVEEAVATQQASHVQTLNDAKKTVNRELANLSAEIRALWDKFYDDFLTQEITIVNLQDDQEALRRTLGGHGVALEECFALSEDATMTFEEFKTTVELDWSRLAREAAGVIRESEGPGQEQESNVSLLMNVAAAGQAQGRNVPLLMYDETSAAGHVQQGQWMAALDNGEIAIEEPAFHVAPSQFLARAAAVEGVEHDDEDEDEEEEEDDDDNEEATLATLRHGERVTHPSWARPSPEGQVIIRTINTALSSVPPNLDVAFAQLDGAATHFGNVSGGRGSNGRTWLTCVSCAYCRYNPRKAYILSYPDARVEARTPGQSFNFFFDHENGVLPPNVRKELMNHLEYQEDMECGPIHVPRYALDP